MKKWWVKLLLVLGVVLLALAILITTSSVHSKNAVERYKDQLRAAGEKLDFNEVFPPRIDPDQNALGLVMQAFAAMPYPATGILSSNPPAVMRLVAPGKAMVGWQQPEILSDDAPHSTNSWADLDAELLAQSPALDFLQQAAERPQLNFELDYNQGAMLLLPHLTRLKQASMLLAASAQSNLRRGDSAAAATNLQTTLRILDEWKGEPLLISQLVRIAMAHITFAAQWEFLQSTNISEPQLAMLQREWTNLQLVQPMEKSLITERVWGMRNIEQLRTSNSPSGAISGWGGPASGGGGSGDWLDTLKDIGDGMKRRTSDNLWRVSWSYDDELAVLRGDQVLIEAVREADTNGYFKDALANRDRELAALGMDRPEANWLRGHLNDELTLLGNETVQSVAHSLERVLVCEAARTMTVTAIALKRHQLRYQSYPGNLSALVPEFLTDIPRDPVDGHPLRYQKLTDNTFVLYSIGGDNVDNGGDATAPVVGRVFQWQRGRDWVWPQPATPPEIDFFRNKPPK